MFMFTVVLFIIVATESVDEILKYDHLNEQYVLVVSSKFATRDARRLVFNVALNKQLLLLQLSMFNKKKSFFTAFGF